MIDYTKTFTTAEKSYDMGLRSYMLKVYNFMSAGLLITGIASYLTLNYAPLTLLMFQIKNGYLIGMTGVGTIISFAPIGIALYFFMGFSKMTTKTAQTLFWVYATLIGMSLASLGFVYTGESIARTFLICSSTFGAMSIYGYSTNRDLTSMGSFFTMGLFGLIISTAANMFLQSSALYFASSLIGIVLFMGIIAWDTQKIKSMYYNVGGGELGQKMAVMSAFSLYLDFINLFIYMLRFFGTRRNN